MNKYVPSWALLADGVTVTGAVYAAISIHAVQRSLFITIVLVAVALVGIGRVMRHLFRYFRRVSIPATESGFMETLQVERLLGRPSMELNSHEIETHIGGKVVLVTGAGGSIGSELCRLLCGYNPKRLVLLGRGENSIYEIEAELKRSFPQSALAPVIADIQDYERLSLVFAKFQPDVVFHAAAYKHVPLMEAHPAEAIRNNVFGTRNVARCAAEFRVGRFVLVSTDKAVNPTSVMGATKYLAEMIVRSMNDSGVTRFVTVRFGNVLGSRGSVIPLFEKQIQRGGPITVTHPEMTRYFMSVREAAQLVLQACVLAEGGEVFVLDMGKPVKIVDLARHMIRLTGLKPDIDIKIRFTGVRPGEKLSEELLNTEEVATATSHNRIYIGKSNMQDGERISEMLGKLEHRVLGDPSASASDIAYSLDQLVLAYRQLSAAKS